MTLAPGQLDVGHLRRMPVDVPHRRERRLGLATTRLVEPPGRQAEGPGLDGVPVGEPVVGVAEDERAGAALVERGPHLRREHLRLLRLGEALTRVHAVLPQQQRHVAGDALEAGQVVAEGRLVVQVDVEADEVDRPRPQVLGRGVVGERHQAVGRLGLGDARPARR